MDTLQAIFTRRCVRAFTQDPVPDKALRQVLEAGVAAASAGNSQPWGFVVVRDPARLAVLRALSPGIIDDPPVVIVVGLDQARVRRYGGKEGEQFAWMSVGIAVQNMLLAAHSLGLGACPVGSFHRKGVRAYLDFPPDVEPVLYVILGHPRVKPTPPGRRNWEAVCFAETWGVAYE